MVLFSASLVTAISSAIALNKYGGSKQTDINYTPCFIAFAVFTSLTGIGALFFKLPPMPKNPHMFKDTIKLLKQPKIFALFVVDFILGALFGSIQVNKNE